MKKSILIFCASLVLAGCGQNQGGSGSSTDQTGTSSGSSSSSTTTNQSSYQGSTTSPGGVDVNTNSSIDTNSSSLKR